MQEFKKDKKIIINYKKIIIICVLILIVSLIIVYGTSSGYHLTCVNAESFSQYKSCVYLYNILNK